jgi:hypothetical protein
MKKIRVLVQAGGEIKDFVFPIDLATEKKLIQTEIEKDKDIEVTGRKITIAVTPDLKIKFRNPKVGKPYIVFVDSDKKIKKRVKMFEKINAHYEDWAGTNFLVVRRKDTDKKEFLLVLADDKYVNTLITH